MSGIEMGLDLKVEAKRCVSCGLCAGACPLSGAWLPPGEVGRPRAKVAMALRHLQETLPLDETAASEFWLRCTMCAACDSACPAGVPLSGIVQGMRSRMLERGATPADAAAALRSVTRYGNPWRRPAGERQCWSEGLKVRRLAPGEPAETVLQVCCTAAFEPRGRKVLRALAEILLRLGEDFAVLGEEETCCGREVYSLGETGLFNRQMEINQALWQEHGVRQIITVSPHCYDAFRNLYSSSPTVYHYTEYLEKRLGKDLAPLKAKPGRVTYHDPCYLSRRGGPVKPARSLLRAVPELELTELPSGGGNLCCGGGGGGMWMGTPRTEKSPVRELLRRAQDAGAQTLAVSCPFCLSTFDSELVSQDEPSLVVRDVAEILLESI